jgi:hypothetical protein
MNDVFLLNDQGPGYVALSACEAGGEGGDPRECAGRVRWVFVNGYPAAGARRWKS